MPETCSRSRLGIRLRPLVRLVAGHVRTRRLAADDLRVERPPALRPCGRSRRFRFSARRRRSSSARATLDRVYLVDAAMGQVLKAVMGPPLLNDVSV
jgi:hypothetical protein